MQAQLNNLFCLHRTDSRVSINSVTSFAGSINTRKAFKEFCKDLYNIGVTAEVIRQKKEDILNIFKSQDTAIASQIHDGNIAGQLPQVSDCSIFFNRNYINRR